MPSVKIHNGDCLDALALLPEASVDAVITDPPYELSFMGKGWDGTGIAFDPATWALCMRALKPGGHLLAFGGSRTWHRLACAVEDAGFELRDSIAWLYGSGFPKSLDVSKAIDKVAGVEFASKPASGVGFMNTSADGYNTTINQLTRVGESTDAARQWAGWGTALKPAFEPIVVARKPLIGTVAANVLAHGAGGLNIDACRIHAADVPAGRTRHGGGIVGNGSSYELPDVRPESPAGRWPTNVVLDIDQADVLDAQSGTLKSGANPTRRGSDKFRDAYGEFAGQQECVAHRGADSGGASRFFPVFKYQAKAPARERPKVDGIAHPTVKPLALMRWLAKLVTPPGGTILDPFAGSGTTGEACVLEGFDVVLIEREADYIPLIHERFHRIIRDRTA